MSARTAPKVAALQMTSTDDVAQNLETAERLSRSAIADGARLVVLPECVAYLGPEAGRLACAEPLPEGGPILDRFRALCREQGAELVLGGFWERSPDPAHVRNSCVHLDAAGEVRALYRKIHLFDVELADGTTLRESEGVEPGRTPIVSDSVVGRLGLSVCYDLRFPELYRALVDRGAVTLVVPSAFTLHTGKDHWHVLLRARAIESQCHVVAAAQYGRHNKRRVSYGHALVCDPWGTVLAECSDGDGYALAPVDQAITERVRRDLPSLRHRRL